MKNIFVNKKMWIGIGCGILAVVLVVGIILMAGGNSNKDPNPTNPSTSATEPTGNVTEPSGTEPDVTEPEYTGPEDPDEVIQEGEPLLPDDYVEPTGPEPTMPEPTDPEPNIDAPEPTDDPDIGAEYDFEGYTALTITYDVWNSWGADTRQAFMYEVYQDITPEELNNFTRQTQYKGYTCGFERNTCLSESEHESQLEAMARGCDYCGKSDCDSFFVVDPNTLFTKFDSTKCPEYDVHKDPCYYCQRCGLPCVGESGDTICHAFICDMNCDWCGKELKAYECHECTIP